MFMIAKWVLTAAAIAAGVLAATGVSFTSIREYAQAVGRAGGKEIAQRLPASVELERLDVVLEKVDAQILSEERTYAEAETALERADANLAASRAHRDRWLKKLEAVRQTLQTTAGSTCGKGADVGREFAAKVHACDDLCQAIRDRETALARQRFAVGKAAEGLARLKNERDRLGHRVATLKSRAQSADLAGAQAGGGGGEDLARAKALADELGERLTADQKVAERLAGWQAPTLPRAAGIEEASKKLDDLLKSHP